LRRAVHEEADEAVGELHHHDARGARRDDLAQGEPQLQVDDGDDPPAQVHYALDEVRGPRHLRDLGGRPYLLDEPDVYRVLLAVEEEGREVLRGLGHDAVLAGGRGEERDVVGAPGLGRGGRRRLGAGGEQRSPRLDLRRDGGGGGGGGRERRLDAREDVLREAGRGQLDPRGRLGL